MNSRAVRWGVYVLIAIGFAVACVFLSNWQFERNQERSAQIALVEKNFDAEPAPLSTLIDESGELDPQDVWRPVLLRGEYLSDEQLLVRNRPHGGTSAFEVLVPFRDLDGRVFIVDRGWVPPGEGDAPDAVPAPPAGVVDVVARLRESEQLPRSGRGAPEGQVPTINLSEIKKVIGGDVITSGYGQLVTESPSGTRLGSFDSPTDDPGPHLSYAIQWILFAVMGFVFIAYIIRTEIVKHREDVSGQPARQSPKPRRDSDADIEDELLDAR